MPSPTTAAAALWWLLRGVGQSVGLGTRAAEPESPVRARHHRHSGRRLTRDQSPASSSSSSEVDGNPAVVPWRTLSQLQRRCENIWRQYEQREPHSYHDLQPLNRWLACWLLGWCEARWRHHPPSTGTSSAAPWSDGDDASDSSSVAANQSLRHRRRRRRRHGGEAAVPPTTTPPAVEAAAHQEWAEHCLVLAGLQWGWISEGGVGLDDGDDDDEPRSSRSAAALASSAATVRALAHCAQLAERFRGGEQAEAATAAHRHCLQALQPPPTGSVLSVGVRIEAHVYALLCLAACLSGPVAVRVETNYALLRQAAHWLCRDPTEHRTDAALRALRLWHPHSPRHLPARRHPAEERGGCATAAPREHRHHRPQQRRPSPRVASHRPSRRRQF
jgi:hypothetical protein